MPHTVPVSMRATTFVWMAAGQPSPIETDGTPIVPKSKALFPCAHCGMPGGFHITQAISDKFTTVRNDNLIWPNGGHWLCAGCTWSFKSLVLRTGLMFARLPDEQAGGGLFHIPTRPWPRPKDLPVGTWWPGRPDALSAILAPPPAPFVAWMPRYGIDHGGEMHIDRTFGPDGNGGICRPADPLIKLQTKHTLPFATISRDARAYVLAVDDLSVIVDVALWTKLRPICEALLREMLAQQVGIEEARFALASLEPPPRSLFSPYEWHRRVRPLYPHAGSRWFEVFLSLLSTKGPV